MKTPEEMAEEYERFNWCVNGLSCRKTYTLVDTLSQVA
jgi:hypothetical protein